MFKFNFVGIQSGIEKMVSDLKSQVGRNIDARMRATGEAMQAEARRRCPVDTGALKASIGFHYNREMRRIVLYADKPYAAFVELGYRRRAGVYVKAQPFLRPAIAAAGKPWGGVEIEAQFTTLAPQYHARTILHTRGRIGRAHVVVGHRPIRIGRPVGRR